MSNSLEFKISADDQASRVVETVQHKVEMFGANLVKMAWHMAGPLALLHIGFEKISTAIEENKRAREEARNAGAEAMIKELESQKKIVEEQRKGYEYTLATAKIQEEKAKKQDQQGLSQEQATASFLKRGFTGELGGDIQKQLIDLASKSEKMTAFGKPNLTAKGVAGAADYYTDLFKNELKFIELGRMWDLEQSRNVDALTKKQKDAQTEAAKEAKDRADRLKADQEEYNRLVKEQTRLQGEIQKLNREKELKGLQDKLKLAQDYQKQQQSALDKARSQGITVSSLREMGGGITGESAAITSQISSRDDAISIAQASLDEAVKATTTLDQQLSAMNSVDSKIEELTNAVIAIQFQLQTANLNSNSPLSPSID